MPGVAGLHNAVVCNGYPTAFFHHCAWAHGRYGDATSRRLRTRCAPTDGAGRELRQGCLALAQVQLLCPTASRGWAVRTLLSTMLAGRSSVRTGEEAKVCARPVGERDPTHLLRSAPPCGRALLRLRYRPSGRRGEHGSGPLPDRGRERQVCGGTVTAPCAAPSRCCGRSSGTLEFHPALPSYPGFSPSTRVLHSRESAKGICGGGQLLRSRPSGCRDAAAGQNCRLLVLAVPGLPDVLARPVSRGCVLAP